MTLPNIVAATAAVAWSGVAHAEVVDGSAFAAGFIHPLRGLDHVLVMLTVGIWSVLAGGRALWAWPTVFVSTMLVGFVAATAGVQLPWVGTAISASIVMLGLLVALAVRAPLWAGAAIIGLFAFFHGHAHGTEVTSVNLLGYGVGFALATAVLHVAGIAAGMVAEGSSGRLAVRALGALTLVGGLACFGGLA
jgi:urease accessory protein